MGLGILGRIRGQDIWSTVVSRGISEIEEVMETQSWDNVRTVAGANMEDALAPRPPTHH